MLSEAIQNQASTRQLTYIKRLRVELGEEQIEAHNQMSSVDASRIISELITIAQKNGISNGKSKPMRINEPRLGMAMKECFRRYTYLGRDIWDKKREFFVEKSIETYKLFTEIAEKMEKNTRVSD